MVFLSYNDAIRLHRVNRAYAALTRDYLLGMRDRHLAASLARRFRASDYAGFRELLQRIVQYSRPVVCEGGGGDVRHVFRNLALPRLLHEMLMQKVRHPTVWETDCCGYIDERFLYELARAGVCLTPCQQNTLLPWGAYVYVHVYLPLKQAIDRGQQHHPTTWDDVDFHGDHRFRRLAQKFTPYHYGSKDRPSKPYV